MLGVQFNAIKRSLELRFILSVILFSILCRPVVALQTSVGPEIAWFDYHERSASGRLLNREKGLLGGASLSVSHQYHNWSGSLNSRYLTGHVDYDGFTQLGNPHQTITRQSLFNLGLSVLYNIPVNTFRISPKLTLERYQWRRSIQPNNGVSGLIENYQWLLMKASVITSTAWASFEIGLNNTMDASMQIEGSRCFPTSTVFPKSDLGWFVSAETTVFSSSAAALNLTGGFSRWSMKQSDTKTANTCIGPVSFHEPDNQTDLWTMGITLTY